MPPDPRLASAHGHDVSVRVFQHELFLSTRTAFFSDLQVQVEISRVFVRD